MDLFNNACRSGAAFRVAFIVKKGTKHAKNAMTVTRNKTHFILEFETTGAMEAKLALEQALKSLDSHCKDFMTSIDAAA